ncbi:hypothetical protein OF83DRAFT_1179685 [Amylostereum chailletii]|nr:hypothetical protein OF83DRAFT_1179685 [Amylostereum chailletii]
MFGRIAKFAEAEKAGIEAASGSATIYQTPLGRGPRQATGSAQTRLPTVEPNDLAQFNAFLFGIPAVGVMRMSVASKALFPDLRVNENILGICGPVVVGGQKVIAMSVVSTFAHFGIIGEIVAHGQVTGSPWGAGAFAGRKDPTAIELEIATSQGGMFYERITATY